MGRRLRGTLRIYAFGAASAGRACSPTRKQLATQSRIPTRNLTLINRHTTYAHNDPAGAFPNNVFFAHLIPFLRGCGRPRHRSRPSPPGHRHRPAGHRANPAPPRHRATRDPRHPGLARPVLDFPRYSWEIRQRPR